VRDCEVGLHLFEKGRIVLGACMKEF